MKIHKGGSEDDKNEFRRSPAVEENTEDEDDNVLKFPVDQPIGDEKCRKKIKNKNDTAEYHPSTKRQVM